jgi:hypothetical protein
VGRGGCEGRSAWQCLCSRTVRLLLLLSVSRTMNAGIGVVERDEEDENRHDSLERVGRDPLRELMLVSDQQLIESRHDGAESRSELTGTRMGGREGGSRARQSCCRCYCCNSYKRWLDVVQLLSPRTVVHAPY